MTVAAILKQKGRTVVHVAPTDSIADVIAKLADHDIGALLVMDRANQMLGILSERDITRALALHGGGVLRMTAAQLMTTEPVVAHPDTGLIDAFRMMSSGRFRHLPVFDGDTLCGLVSIGDLVNARLAAQECEVDSLRAYVTGH